MISRVLAADLPRHVGEHVMIAGWLHRRRELKSVTFLIVRDRSGLAQVVLPGAGRPRGGPPHPGGNRLAGRGRWSPPARRRRAGPSSPSPVVTPLSGAGRAAAVRPVPAVAHGRRCPTILDGAPTSLRHPRAAGRASRSRRPAWPGSGPRSTAWASPRCTRRRSSSRPPSRARTCSASTTSARPAYLAQSPQFYKQAMVGVFERVYEVGRCSGPSRTTRPGTWPSTPAWTPSWASSPTTATSWPSCATRSPAWWRRCGNGPRSARELLGAVLPEVPGEIPDIHFADAQELIAAGDRAGTRAASRTCRPPTSGGCASGRSASSAATSCS